MYHVEASQINVWNSEIITQLLFTSRKRLYSVTPCLFSDLIEIYDIVLNGKVTAFIHVNMCHKPCLSYSHYLSIHYNDKGNTTAVFLPGKSHGQRSLVGHSTQGCEELDLTEYNITPAHPHPSIYAERGVHLGYLQIVYPFYLGNVLNGRLLCGKGLLLGL